jgi:hypothetical protein
MSPPVLLGDVIADFLHDAGQGLIPSDRPYTPAEVRDLRAALGHVDAELGGEPVRAVRAADIEALVGRLRAAGLSERRLAAMLEALRALDRYAGQRRADPLPVPRLSDPAEEKPGSAPPAPAPGPTPTQAVLALGAQASAWTARIVVAAFVLVAIALVAGLD